MFKRKLRDWVGVLLILYTMLLLYWMFIGFQRPAPGSGGYRYNLIPFSTISMYMKHFLSFHFRTWAINILGNIIVFMPFGLLLPVRFQLCRSLIRFLLLFISGLLLLELLQMLLQVGSLDVDDLILNTLGAAAGFLCYRKSLASSLATRDKS